MHRCRSCLQWKGGKRGRLAREWRGGADVRAARMRHSSAVTTEPAAVPAPMSSAGRRGRPERDQDAANQSPARPLVHARYAPRTYALVPAPPDAMMLVDQKIGVPQRALAKRPADQPRFLRRASRGGARLEHWRKQPTENCAARIAGGRRVAIPRWHGVHAAMQRASDTQTRVLASRAAVPPVPATGIARRRHRVLVSDALDEASELIASRCP